MQESTIVSQWAQQQFGECQLGDKRRTARLVSMAQALAQTPGGTMPAVFPEPADLKAAYRFFDTPEADHEAIQAPHWERTRQACREPGTYLIVEDTTDIDLSHRKSPVEGLGWIGDGGGHGFYLHNSLALKLHGWEEHGEPRTQIIGLLAQKWWTREHEPYGSGEKRRARMQRPRESQRWAAILEQISCPKDAQWIFVADRESDIYEVFTRCEAADADFVIRAQAPRAQLEAEGSVFERLAQTTPLGDYEVSLRSRAGVAARTATLQVRSTCVRLRPPYRPDTELAPVTLNLVEAREQAPPEGVSAIHWILLTSLPCDSYDQCCQVLGIYRQRWLIEEYHKALKTGMGIERTQLATGERILALCALVGIVALRLLSMKLMARREPDSPMPQKLLGGVALRILDAQYGAPPDGWTNGTVLRRIAQMGGYQARKGDGPPGWITIWRGWQRLMTMVKAIFLIEGDQKCG